MYDAILAETVTIRGDGGDEIEAYLARPMSPGPHGGVVVLHHMPGYDIQTKEITRNFATHGYNAVMPNLYHREAPGAAPDDAAAAARAQGGVPDARLPGEVAGAAAHLRGLTSANGKVGVIGYCSGGRQSVLAAATVPLDAAVDCYGGMVTGTPPEGSIMSLFSPIKHLVKDVSCPLLGLFGMDDAYPSPEHVAELEQELKAHGKTLRVPLLRGRGPRVLLGQPPVLPPRSRDGRLEPHLHLVRPLPLLARGRPAQPALEAAQMLMPPSTASRSMAASSSSAKSVRPAAARFSSSWGTLLAPMSAEVTRGSRSTQEIASWASVWPRDRAISFSARTCASVCGAIWSAESEPFMARP